MQPKLGSDVVGEQKSGSGRVRDLLFGFGSGSGIKISGTSPSPRVSGFSRVFKLKSRVGVGSGSTFRGQVGVGDHNVGVVPLGFRGFIVSGGLLKYVNFGLK